MHNIDVLSTAAVMFPFKTIRFNRIRDETKLACSYQYVVGTACRGKKNCVLAVSAHHRERGMFFTGSQALNQPPCTIGGHRGWQPSLIGSLHLVDSTQARATSVLMIPSFSYGADRGCRCRRCPYNSHSSSDSGVMSSKVNKEDPASSSSHCCSSHNKRSLTTRVGYSQHLRVFVS